MKWAGLAIGGEVAGIRVASAAAAEFRVRGETLTLENLHFSVSWRMSGNKLAGTAAADVQSKEQLAIGADLFQISLAGGRVLRSSAMTLTSKPKPARILGNPRSTQKSGRHSGRQVTAAYADPESKARFEWRAILLDVSRYLRQELTITAGSRDFPIQEIALWDFEAQGVKVVGTVKGSPAVVGHFYLGFEHPLSSTSVNGSRVRCSLPRVLPLRAGQSLECSSVIGKAPEGQLRRGFLEYVEDQRAHPFRTFLHYNSWYDLGYFSKYDEAGVLDRIKAFGTELHERRGVVLDSFLFDDGWDDSTSLWNFHAGFPNGFSRVAQAAAAYKAGIGVWMSPWGGYGQPKQDRVKYGREQGFEIVSNGFALSGPKYYERFREVCRHMITEYKVNQFKIDGTGNANRVVEGSKFDSDFDAAISLIADLRKLNPDLYVNLTTGTYPSAFWLRYADSTWRGGGDHDFAGVGSWRQKWITYRDANTFRRVVTAGPLYPINSLMLHGLIYAKQAKNLGTDLNGDFRSEVRTYFGTGTQLQEMYITPELLTAENWDDLAEAARWSRSNAQTLIDNHWVGGDPSKLEVYGWAAWSPAGGILTLRNPNEKEQTLSLDIGAAFQLPDDAPHRYQPASPWKNAAAKVDSVLEAGKPHEFRLAPFEVVNLECAPRRG